MFQNADTLWIEVLVVSLVAIFLISILGIYIYKKMHHLPTGECECCQNKSKNLVKQYHKQYKK